MCKPTKCMKVPPGVCGGAPGPMYAWGKGHLGAGGTLRQIGWVKVAVFLCTIHAYMLSYDHLWTLHFPIWKNKHFWNFLCGCAHIRQAYISFQNSIWMRTDGENREILAQRRLFLGFGTLFCLFLDGLLVNFDSDWSFGHARCMRTFYQIWNIPN